MKPIVPILLIGSAAILAAIGAGYCTNKNNPSAAAQESAPVSSPSVAADNSARQPRHGNHEGLDRVRMDNPENSLEKEYEGFRLSFNKKNKTPDYVAWELLGSEADATDVSRTNNFWCDPDIDGCPTPEDYKRSGYNRGHMCPAADQKWSLQAMSDCFVMANMCPQAHALNAGAWNTLENKERQWARRDSAIMIVAGPIYTADDKETIGASQVRVPGAFFKAIIAPYVEKPRGIAFIYPNMSSPGNMENYVTTIDYVEQLTGLDLFYNLPDELENEIESTSSFREWNRKH